MRQHKKLQQTVAPITFPPHVYITPHIYIPPLPSWRMSHIRHTSPTCRHHMPASRQYSRAQSNRRNEQQRLRRANRNNLLNSIRNSRRPSLDEPCERRNQQQQRRRDNAPQASLTSTLAESASYARTPNLSTSISQFWELPPLRPEYNEGQRAFTLDARNDIINTCLLYTSPSPRDQRGSRMPSSA